MDGDDRFMQDTIDLARHRVRKTDTMINSKTRALHEYWNALRAGRLAPLRADIDPREMPCDVRNVFILEHVAAGNIRFRVAGSALADAFGIELRGMNARSIMASESRESFSALLQETLEDPGVGYARLTSRRDPDAIWEISLLPLRSDFGGVDRLIGILVPIGGQPGRRVGPLQFRIDTMRVETINPTVMDADRAPHMEGFSETLTRFQHQEAEEPAAVRGTPKLHAIDGGLESTEQMAPRNGAHLRLVDD